MQAMNELLLDLVDNPTEAAQALDVHDLPMGTLVYYLDSFGDSGNVGIVARATEVSYICLKQTEESRNAYLRRSKEMLTRRGVKALATEAEYQQMCRGLGAPPRPPRRTPTVNDTLAARYAAGQEAYQALAETYPLDYQTFLKAALTKRGITSKEN